MAKPNKTRPLINGVKESKIAKKEAYKERPKKTKNPTHKHLGSVIGTELVEIKESGVEFLHGMFVCDKGLTIQRITDLLYCFFGIDKEGKRFKQNYTFDTKDKSDQLWKELQEYKYGKVKIHSEEAMPVPNITIEEKEEINNELNEFAFWFEKSFSMLPLYYMGNMTLAHLQDHVNKQNPKFSYSIMTDGGVYVMVKNEIGSVRVPADKSQYLNIK
jgi:hypothetical protein